MIMTFDCFKTRSDHLIKDGLELLFINTKNKQGIYFDGAGFQYVDTDKIVNEKWSKTTLSGEILEIREGDGEFALLLTDATIFRILYMPSNYGIYQSILLIKKEANDYKKNLEWFNNYEKVEVL